MSSSGPQIPAHPPALSKQHSLHLKQPTTTTTAITNLPQPNYSLLHIPPLSPLINRQTLRELDLDVIIRNPVLGTFSIFPPSFCYLTMCSISKATTCCLTLVYSSCLVRRVTIPKKYWKAVWHEVKTSCTCVTLEYRRSCMIFSILQASSCTLVRYFRSIVHPCAIAWWKNWDDLPSNLV